MTSLDAYAEQIARGVEKGWPDSDLVRLMAQCVEDFAGIDVRTEQEAFVGEPRGTGSAGWDAALAGLAVHLCRSGGFDRVPDWTRDPRRICPDFFWVGLEPDSTLKAYVFQRTPAYFKGRGVMLDAANLVSV